jgi:hypothetical protein
MESYSQCGQDLFVINILNIDNGTFLDLGCYLPKKINNTYLLVTLGWSGVSVDIVDYSKEWEERATPFIHENCFNLDFKDFLSKYYNSNVIDYLSLDMENVGERYKLLEKVLSSGFKFRIITIEHDSYLGNDYVTNEKNPQREILSKNGYSLICSDVSQQKYPNLEYEDWWINNEFFNIKNLSSWNSENMSCDKIFEKNKINYVINVESQTW